MRITRRDFLRAGLFVVAGSLLSRKDPLEALFAKEPLPFIPDFPGPEDLFPVIKEALSRGGDFSDIYVESTIRRYIELEDGKIREMVFRIERGIGIRVLKDDAVGYAYLNGFDLKGALEAAKTAGRIAKEGKKVAVAAQKERKRRGNVIPVRIPLDSVPVEERIDILKRAFEAAQNEDKEIERVVVS